MKIVLITSQNTSIILSIIKILCIIGVRENEVPNVIQEEGNGSLDGSSEVIL